MVGQTGQKGKEFRMVPVFLENALEERVGRLCGRTSFSFIFWVAPQPLNSPGVAKEPRDGDFQACRDGRESGQGRIPFSLRIIL